MYEVLLKHMHKFSLFFFFFPRTLLFKESDNKTNKQIEDKKGVI